MKARLFMALLCVLGALVPSVFGQRSKILELVKQESGFAKSSFYGEPVHMDRFVATDDSEVSRWTLAALARKFEGRRKDVGLISAEIRDASSWRHGIEESAVFEIGMRGKELKALKGGFELYGMDFYLKSGLAWHPGDDKNVTWTIGKRSSWRYSFRNDRDLAAKVLREPIVALNDGLERFGRRIATLVR